MSHINYWKNYLIDGIMLYGPILIGAVLVLWIGMKLIHTLENIAHKSLKKAKIEASLSSFVVNITSTFLKIMLFISVAGMFGVETTSFIAILGAAGLAIGMALQGSLANFASGVMILLFKPYKIKDLVEINGQLGTVKEITTFTTNLISPDNKLIVVPNSLATANNITNYSSEGKIRVDIHLGISYDADLKVTKSVLLKILESHTNVLKNPKPAILVNELGDSSVNIIMRGYAKPEHYWNVYFDLTEEAKLVLDQNKIDIPYPHQVVHRHDMNKELQKTSL